MIRMTDEVRGIVIDAIESVYPAARRDGWLLHTHSGIMLINVGAIPHEYWFKIAQHLAEQLAKEYEI